jgi:TolA-binding protein
MNPARTLLIVMVAIAVGVWGCARGPSDHGSQAERIRALENRCAKLEQDFRTAVGARDRARKQLAAVEEERAQLQKEAADRAALVKERDELRRQLASRTNERDVLRNRVEKLKRGLQSLITQDDPAQPPGPPVSASECPVADPG